jgi:hypothetical protein
VGNGRSWSRSNALQESAGDSVLNDFSASGNRTAKVVATRGGNHFGLLASDDRPIAGHAADKISARVKPAQRLCSVDTGGVADGRNLLQLLLPLLVFDTYLSILYKDGENIQVSQSCGR